MRVLKPRTSLPTNPSPGSLVCAVIDAVTNASIAAGTGCLHQAYLKTLKSPGAAFLRCRFLGLLLGRCWASPLLGHTRFSPPFPGVSVSLFAQRAGKFSPPPPPVRDPSVGEKWLLGDGVTREARRGDVVPTSTGAPQGVNSLPVPPCPCRPAVAVAWPPVLNAGGFGARVGVCWCSAAPDGICRRASPDLCA